MFPGQKFCRDLLTNKNSLPLLCRARRLTIAGGGRIIFQQRHEPENWKPGVSLLSAIGSDVTLNKIFYFPIFDFCSMADGRKYFFLSMSIFQRISKMFVIF